MIQSVNNLFTDPEHREDTAEIMRHVMADPDVQRFIQEHHDELGDQALERGQSKLYEFVHEKKLVAAGKSSVAPGYYPRLMLFAGQIGVGYVPTKEYQAAQAAKELHDRVTAWYMPKYIRQASFDDFWFQGSNSSPSRNAAFKAIYEFYEQYDGQKFIPGLYLSGEFGVGKTYLLGALANALAKKGIASLLVHFPSFAVSMKSSIADNTADQKRDDVKKAPILMIDDIGADSLSAWMRDEVLGVILEYRMQEELPTFFSSNFTMSQLTDHLSQDTNGVNSPLKAQRIMERVRYLSREYDISGKNLRQQR